MTKRPIVAIADDDPIAREVLANALEERCDVHAFDSGRRLLDHLASNPIDLLLLDVEMPGLSGYETCQWVRSGPGQSSLPVIFLSAHASLEDRLLGYAAGGNDYLTKPFDTDELTAKIRVALDAADRIRQLATEAASMSEAAAVTAEMMGEVGVVLEFQRAIAGCVAPEGVADAVFDALDRFGLGGCLRLHTREGTISRSSAGVPSALENSLLQRLEATPDARIVTLGTNLGFAYAGVTLLVRRLAWATAPQAAETLDALGRARDNLALIVEGALARMRAVEAEVDARHLVVARQLIEVTRDALRDLEAAARAVYDDLDSVFESAREDFEFLFPQLGLTLEQEEKLVAIVARQRSQGLDALARGRQAELRLHTLLDRMAGGQAVPTDA